MRYLLFVAFLSFATPSFAQQQYQDWGQAYGFKAKDKKYIYADVANIRVAPAQDALLKDSLIHGDEITILSIGTAQTMNGKEAPWCEVGYIKNGNSKTGYLWAGLLSPRSLQNGDVLFLYGMKFSVTSGQPSVVDVKALLKDSLITRCSFNISPIETAAGSHEAEVLSPKGLTGLRCLLRFYYSGEACAIPTIEQYIGWDGTHFTVLPQIYSEADAGAYVIEQKYTFPSDKGGKPGEVKMRELIEQYGDDLDKPESRKVRTIHYRWNSATKKLVKQ